MTPEDQARSRQWLAIQSIAADLRWFRERQERLDALEAARKAIPVPPTPPEATSSLRPRKVLRVPPEYGYTP